MAGRNNKAGRSSGGFKATTAAANPNALAAARRIDRAAGLQRKALGRLDAITTERREAALRIRPTTSDQAARYMRAGKSVTSGVDIRAQNYLSGSAMPGAKQGRERGYRAPASRLR
jgi:hypothetical protein